MSGPRRYYSLFLPLLAAAGAAFCALSAHAHEVDTCLARLAQTAQLLKACEVAQKQEGQCDNLRNRLQRNRQTCRAEAFTEESIDHAMAYGRNDVDGDTNRSPYRQAVTQRQREESQMQPNLVRFNQHFPQFGNFRDAVAERFNSRLCPNAYEGGRDRWLYTGTMSLQRYSLDEVKPGPPQSRDLRFFAQGRAGECYRVPPQLEPGAPFLVVNLPDQMLSQLEQKGGVVKCESATCTTDRTSQEELYQRYQAEYRRYRLLRDCVDQAQRAKTQGASKGGAPTVSLPSHCPTKEINVALLNAKGLVQELDRQLFEPPTRPLAAPLPAQQNVTKTE